MRNEAHFFDPNNGHRDYKNSEQQNLLGLLSEPSLATDEIHLESKLQSLLSSDVAAKTLTSDGFLTTTKEQELINKTEDMQTSSFTKEDLNKLLSKENNEFVEDIPSAQVPRQSTSSEHRSEQPKERPSTSNHEQDGSGRKRHRDQSPPKPAPA